MDPIENINGLRTDKGFTVLRIITSSWRQSYAFEKSPTMKQNYFLSFTFWLDQNNGHMIVSPSKTLVGRILIALYDTGFIRTEQKTKWPSGHHDGHHVTIWYSRRDLDDFSGSN